MTNPGIWPSRDQFHIFGDDHVLRPGASYGLEDPQEKNTDADRDGKTHPPDDLG